LEIGLHWIKLLSVFSWFFIMGFSVHIESLQLWCLSSMCSYICNSFPKIVILSPVASDLDLPLLSIFHPLSMKCL
jgi:hypothetical protein